MELVLNFISSYGVLCINVLGVVALLFISYNSNKLSKGETKIKGALDLKSKKRQVNKKGALKEEEETKEPDMNHVRDCEKEFNDICTMYQVIIQFVPLFPLLGILGTVAGLMLQVQGLNGEDGWNNLITSLDTALSTTFWGLIWAIGLKAVVAIVPARIIYNVEVMLEDYDKKFSGNIALKNITED